MNEPGSKGKWLKGWSGGAVEGGRGWRPIERKIMCIFVHATCPKGTARHLTQPIQGGINKWFHKGTHNKRLRKSECQSSEMKRNEVKWNENPRKGHENIIVGDTQHTTHTHTRRSTEKTQSQRDHMNGFGVTGDPAGVLRNVRFKNKIQDKIVPHGCLRYSHIEIQIHNWAEEASLDLLIAACRRTNTFPGWPGWVLIYERGISLNSNINT